MPQTGTAWVPVLPDTSKVTPQTRSAFRGLGPFQVVVEAQLRNLPSVRAALASIPHIVLPVDVDDRELMELRRELQALGNRTVGVDIPAGEARRTLDDLMGRLDRLSGRSARMDVRVDAGAASSALRESGREVSRLDGRSARVSVGATVAGAIAGLVSVKTLLTRLHGDRATIRVALDAVGAVVGLAATAAKVVALTGVIGGLVGSGMGLIGMLGGVGAAAAVAGAGLGVALLAFLGVGEALSALSAQEKSAATDAQTAAKQQVASARAVDDAKRQQARTAQTARDARVEAARDVQRAEEESAKAIARAQAETAKAVERAVAQSEKQVASAREQAQRAVTSAREQAARALESATKQAEQALRRESDAAKTLIREQRNLTSVRERAARSVESASRTAESAWRRQGQATSDLAREVRGLADAYEQGRRGLEDMQDQVEGNALAQRRAAFDLRDAQADLDRARGTGDTELIARAQLAYDEQVESIDRLTKQTQRLAADNAKAQAGGVAGSDAVTSALERIEAAQERARESSQAAADADVALAQARVDAAEQVAAAKERVTDAEAASVEASRAARDAEDELRATRVEGAAAIAQARADGAAQIAEAEAEGRARVVEAEEAGAARIAEARESGAARIAAAQEAGAARIVAADEAAADAQRALTRALADTGITGTTAAQNVATAFAALSPAAAGFVTFLWGMRPALDALSAAAASGFFPPLQRGLSALAGQLPGLTTIVFKLANAMGRGLELVLTQLASPFWMWFFNVLANASGTIIPMLFQSLMTLAGAAAMLIVHLLPLAPAAFALLDQFSRLVVILAPFIAQMLGGLMPAFSALLTALLPLGPLLVALTPILSILAHAFAQVLGALLVALTPVLIALTPLIAQLATQFATGLVSALVAVTPLLVSLATWMSQNPGLVIAIIGILGGLISGWRILASVVGGLLGPLALIRIGMSLFGVSATSLFGPLAGVATTVGAFFSKLVGGVGIIGLARGAISGLGWILGWLARTVLSAFGPFTVLALIFTHLYTTNSQFRDAVNQLFAAFGGVVSAVLTALMPAFTALTPIISQGAVVFANVATGLAQFLVPAISALARWIQFITPVLGPMIAGFLGVVGAVKAWRIAQLLLNVALRMNPIGAVVLAIAALVGGIVWAYNNVKWFRDGVNTAWAYIRAAWSLGVAAIRTLWFSVFRPILMAPVDLLKWVWNAGIRPWWDGVKDAFWRGVSSIGSAWDSLKRLLAVPVNFVIDWVWNRGIVPAWNAVAGLVGLPRMGFARRIGGFADGGVADGPGVLPGYTPGRDVMYAAVSGGEAFMRPEWTRAVGRPFIDGGNAAARAGGAPAVRRFLEASPTFASTGGATPTTGRVVGRFAGGGVLGRLPGAGLLRNAYIRTTNPIINSISRLVGPPPPTWRRMPPAAAIKVRDAVGRFLFGGFADGGIVSRRRRRRAELWRMFARSAPRPATIPTPRPPGDGDGPPGRPPLPPGAAAGVATTLAALDATRTGVDRAATATASIASSTVGGTSHTTTYDIDIHAVPGEDVDALVERVVRRIDSQIRTTVG